MDYPFEEENPKTIYRESYEEFIRKFSKVKKISIFDTSKFIRNCIIDVSQNMNIPSSQVFNTLFRSEENIDSMDRCEQLIIDMF